MYSSTHDIHLTEGKEISTRNTGARDNALNINKAPTISMRKPMIHNLLKAYARITCKKRKGKISAKLSSSSTHNIHK